MKVSETVLPGSVRSRTRERDSGSPQSILIAFLMMTTELLASFAAAMVEHLAH